MAPEGRCFTFVWKLENASYCTQKRGEILNSPAFVVDAIQNTKWSLQLHPRGPKNDGNNIGYYLCREKDSSGKVNVEVKFELAFIGKDGSNLTNIGAAKMAFSKGSALGWTSTTPRKDVFVTRKSIFLPNDTLTLRCRMWKGEGDMTEDVKCTAVTRIGVEKRSSKWEMKNFSSLKLDEKLNLQIKSVPKESPLMSVDLLLIGGLNSKELIRFKLSLLEATVKFATLRLFLLSSSGKRIECNQEEMWFENQTASKQINFTFTKKNLLERKDVYLPNDTLSLIWEWGFSKGIVSEGPEEDEQGCICSQVTISDAHNSSDDQKTLLNQFVDKMKCLYDEGFLSDVKLKTATSEFPAHKFTLSVSSSVFKAMFSCDMKEYINDCVYIEDMDDETVNRMLLFIYTTRVEDLNFKSAIDLYEAADKYDIITLKNINSSFLKKNLSPKNACDVLLLADSHGDSELKSDVQDYIIKNGKQITQSDEWKTLMNVNPTLAAETAVKAFG